MPKAEIAGNDYDLSINRYKELEYEAVEYDPPKVILKRLAEAGGGDRGGAGGVGGDAQDELDRRVATIGEVCEVVSGATPKTRQAGVLGRERSLGDAEGSE